MGTVDIVLIVILLIFFGVGFKEGFVKNVIQLMGLVVLLLVIGKGGHLIKLSLMSEFGWSEFAASVIAYALVIIVIVLVVKLVVWLLHNFIEFLHLMWLNKLLGAVLGTLSGFLILVLLLLILNISPFEDEVKGKVTQLGEKSFIVKLINDVAEKIEERYPRFRIKNPANEYKKKMLDESEKIKEIIIKR